MNGGSFTQTGLKEMRDAIEQFAPEQTAALREVARKGADRILERERQLLAQQTHGEGNTAAALKVTEDPANKLFEVHFGLIKNRPANIGIWLEYGTVHMAARPFVRPAADAERDPIRREMESASETAAKETFG